MGRIGVGTGDTRHCPNVKGNTRASDARFLVFLMRGYLARSGLGFAKVFQYLVCIRILGKGCRLISRRVGWKRMGDMRM